MIKLEILKMAFRKLKVKGASSDPSLPQYPDALIDLEAMMAELDATPSIITGYNSTGFNAELDEESGLTIEDLNTIACGLAVRIGGDYGIEVPFLVGKGYSTGVRKMFIRGAILPIVKYTNRTPRGLGNTSNNVYSNSRSNLYYNGSKTSSNADHYSVDSFINLPVDFTAWVLDEVLTNVVWVSENSKIKIENQTFTDKVATAKLTFTNAGVYKIQVTGTTATKQKVFDFDFAIHDKLEG